MKVTDIMVGDWVMNPFQVDTCESPYAKIDSIDGERVTFLLDGFVKITGSEKDLNPIPLTSELLESSGFGRICQKGCVEPYYWQFYNEEEHQIVNAFNRIYRGMWIECCNPTTGAIVNKQCEFVHELQRVLKVCEVEKEIQLWS